MIQPYPRFPDFEYVKPQSIEEAVQFLTDHPDQSRPYAGGTDCFVLLRDRRIKSKYLLDLKALPELTQISFDPQKGLTIGATVSMNQAAKEAALQEHYPAIAAAIHEVGSYQLRSRATLVGNLCNASPCGDTIGPCLVYGAQINIIGTNGEYTLGIKDFFKGPGKTALTPGEIVKSITLPLPPKGAAGVYKSIGRNKLGDLALAAVTVLGFPASSTKSGLDFRITLSAVAPTVIFAEEARALLAGEVITTKTVEQAAQAAMQACKPIDDIRSSAAYRREMIRVLTSRALHSVCKQLSISL
jgi:CO/xanthine dehydrogenase FAD-binding subunit